MFKHQTPFENQPASAGEAASTTRTPLRSPVVLGAGPVGRAVAARLVERGLTPVMITRSGSTIDGARPLPLDVTDPAALAAALDGADAVFHSAQPAYHRWVEEFPALQRSVLDAAARAGAGVVVAVENLYPYGAPAAGRPMTESTPFDPCSRKGEVRARLAAELAAAHAEGRVATAAVRASDFLGPGVTGSAYGERFVEPLVKGRAAEVLGDPDTRHSVTYVPDLAETLVRVAERPDAWGRAWHAPSAPAVTQRELVALVAAAAGTEPRLRVLKPWMLRLVGRFNPGARETVEMLYEFEADFVLDSSAAERAFGLAPTPLATAAAATVSSGRGR